MTNDSGFSRVPYPEHPNRCQSVNSVGQCLNLAVILPDGSYGTNCLAHNGNMQINRAKVNGLRNYNLSKWQARVEQFGSSSDVKSLRDEIGILRLLMEERLNRCQDAQDLILQSAPIADLVMKIEKVVASCHKLEGSMGQLLDKQAILQFAQQVIAIIGAALVGQEEKIDQIASEIVKVISPEQDNQ